MSQESAKPNGVQQIITVPLLQNQQQPTNPYYAPYGQQQQNQVPQLHNPYEIINVTSNVQPNTQQIPQQIPQQSSQQQYLQQPIVGQHLVANYSPNQQPTLQAMQPQLIPYAPQVLNDASGFRVPALVQCPYCNQHSITTISYKPGNNTYWMSVLLCICFGLLCLIPLLSSDCKDVIHSCSYCGKIVGQTEYKPCE